MVHKESGFNQSETNSGFAQAHRDVFQARLPCIKYGEVKQRQHFCHHGDTICQNQAM